MTLTKSIISFKFFDCDYDYIMCKQCIRLMLLRIFQSIVKKFNLTLIHCDSSLFMVSCLECLVLPYPPYPFPVFLNVKVSCNFF